jgi:hypothetical protein
MGALNGWLIPGLIGGGIAVAVLALTWGPRSFRKALVERMIARADGVRPPRDSGPDR